MEQNKLNRGVLFTNKRKEKDTHPDYTGSYVGLDGNEFWVSSWINKSNKGETYMSFQLKPKDDSKAPQKAQPSNNGWQSASKVKEEENALPF